MANSPIQLKPRKDGIEKRELVPQISMVQSENNLIVSSFMGLMDVTVIISDETGTTVDVENFVVHPEQPYVVRLSSMEPGTYQVKVLVGGFELYGEFDVE